MPKNSALKAIFTELTPEEKKIMGTANVVDIATKRHHVYSAQYYRQRALMLENLRSAGTTEIPDLRQKHQLAVSEETRETHAKQASSLKHEGIEHIFSSAFAQFVYGR